MDKPFEDSKTGLEPIAKRIAIERKIDLRFPTFEGMVTGVSANLSTSGMFIQSNSPEETGTEFAFALRIDEWSPIQGTARVIWTRLITEGPERPAGMGVQFLDLDAQSRRMIRWLVDKHLQQGGTLFDLDTVPAGASKYSGESTKRARRSPKRSRRAGGGSPSGNRWLLVALCVLILGGAAAGIYLQWFDPRSGGDTPSVSTDSDSPATDTGTEPAPTDPVATPEPVPDPAPVTLDAVAGFIESWADALEEQDTEAVLAHYAADFDASAAGGRPAWEASLRQRLEGTEHIRVAISGLDVSFSESGAARAVFFRSWRSESRDESNRLALDLEPSVDGWKIRREQSLD